MPDESRAGTLPTALIIPHYRWSYGQSREEIRSNLQSSAPARLSGGMPYCTLLSPSCHARGWFAARKRARAKGEFEARKRARAKEGCGGVCESRKHERTK